MRPAGKRMRVRAGEAGAGEDKASQWASTGGPDARAAGLESWPGCGQAGVAGAEEQDGQNMATLQQVGAEQPANACRGARGRMRAKEAQARACAWGSSLQPPCGVQVHEATVCMDFAAAYRMQLPLGRARGQLGGGSAAAAWERDVRQPQCAGRHDGCSSRTGRAERPGATAGGMDAGERARRNAGLRTDERVRGHGDDARNGPAGQRRTRTRTCTVHRGGCCRGQTAPTRMGTGARAC